MPTLYGAAAFAPATEWLVELQRNPDGTRAPGPQWDAYNLERIRNEFSGEPRAPRDKSANGRDASSEWPRERHRELETGCRLRRERRVDAATPRWPDSSGHDHRDLDWLFAKWDHVFRNL